MNHSVLVVRRNETECAETVQQAVNSHPLHQPSEVMLSHVRFGDSLASKEKPQRGGFYPQYTVSLATLQMAATGKTRTSLGTLLQENKVRVY